jgi:GAF domain-containing protein
MRSHPSPPLSVVGGRTAATARLRVVSPGSHDADGVVAAWSGQPADGDGMLLRAARVTESLSGQGLLADVLVAVARRAVDVLEADVAAIGLPDDTGTTLTIDVATGDPELVLGGMTIPAAAWHLDDVLQHGRSVVVADLWSSGLHPSLLDLARIGPCLAVPLWAAMQPYAVLLAGRHRGAQPFPDDAERRLWQLPSNPRAAARRAWNAPARGRVASFAGSPA